MEPSDRATQRGSWRDAVDSGVVDALTRAIDELAEFPVLDSTVQQILALCDDPESSTAELVGALEVDQSFAANLLRYANSAALARPIRAKTVRQAVMLVGRRGLRRLSMEAATFRFLERLPGSNAGVRGQLHLHAISVAVTAAAAADVARVRGDGPHLAGLIHDIGKLVLPLAFGEQAVAEITSVHASGQQRATAEREQLGIDHAVAGALLAERWGFAPEVVDAVAMHHGGPTGIAVPTAEIACVQLANSVADMLSGGQADHALIEVALDRLGLGADALDSLAIAASTPLGAAATGRLAALATDTSTLDQHDDLTGLANRRHWLQHVRRDLAERRAGSVLVVAVGGLTDIARAHGPESADLILTEVARVAGRHGFAGRIGTSVLALWVDGALADARRAATEIADEVEISQDPGAPVTLRFGLSTASDDGADLAALLLAADTALAPLSAEPSPTPLDAPSAPTDLGPAAASDRDAA